MKSFKIFISEKTTISSEGKSEILFTKEGVLFPCKDYYLLVKELQPEGKKRMHYKEFTAGYGNTKLSIKKH